MLHHFSADYKIRKTISEGQVLNIALYKVRIRNPSLCPAKVPSIDINANDSRRPKIPRNQTRPAADIECKP